MKGLLPALVLVQLWSMGSAETKLQDFQVLYDKSFNLTCESESFNASQLPIRDQPLYYFWILPNGAYIGSDHKEPFENERAVIGGTGDEFGKILTIKRADDDDYGIYHCLILTVGGQYKLAVRKGINTDGPYYGDLLDKYRTNIIIGVCAGGGLLVICIIGCLVYHLRYRTNEDEDGDEEKLNGRIGEKHSYDNFGSDKLDDDEDGATTDERYAEIHLEGKNKAAVPDSSEEDTTKL